MQKQTREDRNLRIAIGWTFLAWINLSTFTSPYLIGNSSLAAQLTTLPTKVILFTGLLTIAFLTSGVGLAIATAVTAFALLGAFLYFCTPILRSTPYACVTFVTLFFAIFSVPGLLLGAAFP